MQRTGIVTIIVAVGALGLATQVVLMRELMAAFGGNEFSAGVIISLWILFEGTGAWLIGRLGPSRGAARLLPLSVASSALVSAIAVPATVLCRPLFGVLPGESFSIPLLVATTAVVVLLPAATHGALFVLGAAALAGNDEEGLPGGATAQAHIGRAYAWEGTGTALGGLALAFILFGSVPATAAVSLFGFAAVVTAGLWGSATRRSSAATRLRSGLALLVFVGLLAIGILGGRGIERWAWQRYWPGQRVASVVDSHYGKIVRLQRGDQQLAQYNGSTVAAFPTMNPEGLEELIHIPLLAGPPARRLLLIGPAFGGYLGEALQHPLERVTVVELDALLTSELRVAAGRPAWSEASDPRVRLVNGDPLRYLQTGGESFDRIILLDAVPASLGASRLFTTEFYRRCRDRLAPGGILAVAGPGPGDGTSPDAAAMLATRLMTLQWVWGDTAGGRRNGPGSCRAGSVMLLALDVPLFLASDSAIPDPQELPGRLARAGRGASAQGHIRTRVLDSTYLAGLLDPFRQEVLATRVAAAAPHTWTLLNTPTRALELFLNMARENKLSSPGFGRWYRGLLGLRTPHLIPGLALVLAAAAALARRFRSRFSQAYGVFTSGLAGSGLVTMAIFSFQMRFGAAYSNAALLVAGFMAGTVLGGAAGAGEAQAPKVISGSGAAPAPRAPAARTRRKRPGSYQAVLFLLADAALAFCVLAQPVLGFSGTVAQFVAVMVLAGFCVGLQFPIAAGAHGDSGVGRSAGILTALDLGGGCVGALAVALVLVPVLGLGASAALLVSLKLGSVLVQLFGLPAAQLR